MLKQLRYYISVIETNSFTEAGEQNFISQSAISQQIKSLEQEIGVSLLVRQNRKFTLTKAGEYFYKQGKILLEQEEKLILETVKIANDNRPRLTIGYLQNYGGYEFYNAMQIFSQKYPEVIVELVGGSHEDLAELSKQSLVDLFFNDQRRVFSDNYVNIELGKRECFLEVSESSDLCENSKVNVADLNNNSIIIICPKEKYKVEQEYYKLTFGFKDNFIHANSIEEARLKVVSNMGVLPIDGVNNQINAHIKSIPFYLKASQITHNYCLFWKKDLENELMLEFAKIIQEQFA